MFDKAKFTNYQVKFFDKEGTVLKEETIQGTNEATALTLGKHIVESTPEYHSCTVFCGNLQTAYSYTKEE